jgi:hypothetical protein
LRRRSPLFPLPPMIFRFNAPKDLSRSTKVSMAQTGSLPISLFFAGAVEVFTSFFFSFSLMPRSSRASRSGGSCSLGSSNN